MKYRPKPHQSPGWSMKGNYLIDVPNGLTRWEKFLLAEQIDENCLENNPKVLKFLIKNSHTYFVPTRVLKMYGMEWDD